MPRMPPRKEPKEAVVYEMSSKRKAPPFKPQRPSKIPRVSTTGSESSSAKPVTKSAYTTARKPARPQVIEDDKEEDDEEGRVGKGSGKSAQRSIRSSGILSDSDEELASDPLATRPKKKPPISTAAALMGSRPPPPKRKPSAPPQPSPSPISDAASLSPPAYPAPSPSHSPPPPSPSQSSSSDVPLIPQPLLMRLLHEHFRDKTTQIDKHAAQVLQKYMDIFVREAIARTALAKAEKTERGAAAVEDRGWLEVEDLQGVAAGMVLDF